MGKAWGRCYKSDAVLEVWEYQERKVLSLHSLPPLMLALNPHL
jgi:hypothetical protein